MVSFPKSGRILKYKKEPRTSSKALQAQLASIRVSVYGLRKDWGAMEETISVPLSVIQNISAVKSGL